MSGHPGYLRQSYGPPYRFCRLLTGAQGHRLRRIAMMGTQGHQITKVIA